MRFEEFVAARSPALLRYATLLAGEPEEARDIVQEVLTRALVKWSRILKTEQPYAYVRRMVTNESLSRHRRRSQAITVTQLRKVAENTTYTDCRDRSTWLPPVG
jgi:DNA-directed RNA polymerase specialized sigma24 family protein